MYLGDFALGATFDVKLTTRQFSTGAPFASSSLAIAAYPDNSTTEITAGITVSAAFDSRTGLHNVRVVATSGNGYATATNYALVVTAGTVDSVSVVGETVAHFSIENRSGLRPSTAGRTLAVESDGMAHADVKEVAGTTQTARDLGASVLLSPGTGTGQIALSSGAVTAGTVNDKTGYALHGDYDAAKTAASQSSVDAIDTKVGTPVDLDDAGASVSDNLVTVYNRVNLVKNVTDTLEDVPEDISALPVDTADAVLTRDWSSVTGEASRSVLNALRFLRNAWSVAGSPPTVTVTAEDDTTPVWSKPVTPAPGADPISGVGADDV